MGKGASRLLPNVLPLGDVVKKYTELLRLLQVRKAQNQLQIKPNIAILPNGCYVRLWVFKTKSDEITRN